MKRKRSYHTAFKTVSTNEDRFFGNEIVSAIRGFTKENILHDLLVEIDGQTFKCHKFILASCSLYFRDFCRSWLGGENELVTLSSISAQTFQTILHMISTSRSALTMDNVLEVWRAAHFLQIEFLVDDCERFAEDHVAVETMEDIYRHAMLYDAVGVRKAVVTFVQKHYEVMCISEAFLALTFDDLHGMIKSDKLKVTSEDAVLRSLFRWASHHGQAKTVNETDATKGDNDSDVKRIKLCNSSSSSRQNCQQLVNRSAYLSRLLKASRYSLASSVCLGELLTNSLAESDLEVKNILLEAVQYRLSENKHGFWPSSACYRKLSGMVHVGVCVNKHRIKAWDLKHDSWLTLPRCSYREKNRNAVTVLDNDLYLLVNEGEDGTKGLYVLRKNYWYRWSYVLTLPGVEIVMVAKGNSIYAFDRCTGRVHCISPQGSTSGRCRELRAPKLINFRHAFCFESSILIFCSSEKGPAEVTDVYRFIVASQEWRKCGTLSGPAKYIVNFRSDSCHYVIQRNGQMWQVVPDAEQRPRFTYVKKLWWFVDRPRGAFIYKSKLYVVGNNHKYHGDDAGVDGVFKKLVYFRLPNCSSNFAHCVLPKKCLSDKSGRFY